MQTLNLSVRSIVDLLRRVKDELHVSQSANQQKVIDADLARIRSYQLNLKEMAASYYKIQTPDFPKSSPVVIELGDSRPYEAVENASINDLVTLYHKMEIELVESASSRLAMGFNSHDYTRFQSYLAVVDQMLEAYVIPYTPVDFPETSFRTAAQGNIKGVGVGTIANA